MKPIRVNEIRIYMGANKELKNKKVRLVGKLGRLGVFEYNGQRHACPIRVLWRIEK